MESEEYIDFESHPVTKQIADRTVEGFDMQFYCLDFLVASQLLALNLGERTLLFQFQAEDRDFDELMPVFEAIATSLLQNATSDIRE